MKNCLQDCTQGIVVKGSASRWKSVVGCVPQESVLGLMPFNIFISDINSWIKWTLSKLVDDIKLCGAVDMSKGWDAILRDLDRLKRWAQENLMRFSKSKCKVLQLDYGNPHYQYELRGGLSAVLLKRTWGSTGGWQAGHDPWKCPHRPENQLYPELHKKKCG